MQVGVNVSEYRKMYEEAEEKTFSLQQRLARAQRERDDLKLIAVETLSQSQEEIERLKSIIDRMQPLVDEVCDSDIAKLPLDVQNARIRYQLKEEDA